MESTMKNKKSYYTVAMAVASIIATPRSWALPADLDALASVVYSYHSGALKRGMVRLN